MIKKILNGLLFLTLMFFSCNNDPDCDCGMIEAKYTELTEENGSIYYFNINNDCTNQVEFSIQMNYSIYSNYMAGERICDIDEIRLN